MVNEKLVSSLQPALITSPSNLFYYSGLQNSDAFILISNDSRYYVTDSRYEIEAKGLKPSFIPVILSRSEQIDFLREKLVSASTVWIEKENMSLSLFESIFGNKSARFMPLDETIRKDRFSKSFEELRLIKEAESIVDSSFEAILEYLKPGVTEKEVSDRLLFEMLSRGASGPAFDTIVAFGENAAKPHAVPSMRKLAKGDAVVMDFGAKLGGYCSDFTRTVFLGEVPDRAKRAYDVVLEAHKSALRYIENGGRSCFEADKTARSVINQSEFAGLFTHSLGHGVGIDIHEAPYLGVSSKDVLSEGAVFTIEPGIYLQGEFGIRIESLATIENGKLTVIDRSDKEIITI